MYPTIHAALLISKTLQSGTGNSKQDMSDCQMESLRFLSLRREGLEQTCHLPLDFCFRRSSPALTGRNNPTGSVMPNQASRAEAFVLLPMVRMAEPLWVLPYSCCLRAISQSGPGFARTP